MPTQVSLLDGALASAGTLAIQTNGTTSAITISSAQVATFVNNPIMTGLTASRAVFTDGSKGLTSNAITGTGNVVMSASPTLTGTIDGAALTLSSSLTLSGGTANGVLYLNGSKVATSGSALTFDGTNLGIGGAASMYWSGANKGLAIAGSTNGAEIDLKISGGTSTSVLLQDVASNLRLGNSGNFPIIFHISDTEQMRLTSTGLGIGTSSPQSKLHIDVDGTALRISRGSSIGFLYNTGTASTDITRLQSNGGSVQLYTSGGTATLDPSGNLGLGVTPSAWATIVPAMQIGNSSYATYANRLYAGANWYYNAGDKYITSDYATLYQQALGKHIWYTAPSGTAGNAITFTQAMTLDASGNLGLGTSSPAFGSGSGLEIERAGIATLRLENSSAGNNLEIYNDSLANGINFRGYNAAPMVFWTNNTERARIDSSGNLLVGTTSGSWTGNDARIYSVVSSGWVESLYTTGSAGGASIMRVDNTGAKFIDFRYTSTNVGSITTNGTTTAYNITSDYRLKENVQPMQNALGVVAQLKPVTYNWKSNGSASQGFIAHELQAVVPDCVTGEKDAVDAEGNPVYQGIDTSFLVATLTAAIQEQQAIIEQLKARLDAANI